MSFKKLKVKNPSQRLVRLWRKKLKVESKVKNIHKNNFRLLTRLWTLDFRLLTFITLLAALLRFYNLMWGDGFFFHPDERNMAAAVSQLCFSLARVTPAELFQPRAAGSCSMNPHFFAYGSFPLYLAYFSHVVVKFAGQLFSPRALSLEPRAASFNEVIFWLRFWSALSSTLTIPVVYLITKELFANKKASKQVRGISDVSAGKPATDPQYYIGYHKKEVLSSPQKDSGSCGADGSCTRNVRLRVGWFTQLAYGPFSAGAKFILSKLEKLVNKPPLIAATLTAFTPGLIQAAHFGTTESLLTFFFMLTLYLSLKLKVKSPSQRLVRLWRKKLKVKSKVKSFPKNNFGFLTRLLTFNFGFLTVLGIVAGLALATKLTAVYFLIPLLLVLLFKLNPQKIHTNFTSGRRFFMQVFLFLFVALVSFFLVSPYNFLDFQAFLNTSLYETKVATGEIKTFYTRQFENTTPLLFQITHIFPYALGWPMFILGSFGFLLMLITITGDVFSYCYKLKVKSQKLKVEFEVKSFQKNNFKFLTRLWTLPPYQSKARYGATLNRPPKRRTGLGLDFGLLILLIAFLTYLLPNVFLFAKWTRFMTPIFPFFAIFAAYFFHLLFTRCQALGTSNQLSHQKTLRLGGLSAGTPRSEGLLDPSSIFLITQKDHFVKSQNRGVDPEGVEPSRPDLTDPVPRRRGPTPRIILASLKSLVNLFLIFSFLFFILLLPGLFFFQIYTKPDVRIQASKWIFENIPDSSYLLSETGNVVDIPLPDTRHQMPVTNFDFYHLDENPAFLEELVDHLERADYILVPSRRIFANHLRLPEKYPITSRYYQALFDGRLGFELVHVQTYKGSEQPADAEAFFKRAAARWRDESLTGNGKFASFSSQLLKKVRQIFPKRVRHTFKINQGSTRATLASDSRTSLTGGKRALLLAGEAAEETWTVFDHPVVRIFKKVTPHDKLYYQNILKPI